MGPLQVGLTTTDGMTTAEITALTGMKAGDRVFDTTVGVWTYYTGSLWLREQWRSYDESELIISGFTAGVDNVDAIPFVTPDGKMRISLNIEGRLTVASASPSITLTDVIFEAITGAGKNTFSVMGGSGNFSTGRVQSTAGALVLVHGAASASWGLSGELTLASWPSWAEPVP